jgi:surface polysaccharide O-acyltransferase-like enzyme
MRKNSEISIYDVISQTRFPLIVLVTYAHSYGAVADNYSLLFSDWNTYEFLKLLISQTLSKIAVPSFFLMSGYLFFANVENWTWQAYRKKIVRRLQTLLLPYVLWNLLMAYKLRVWGWKVFWVFWSHVGVQNDIFGSEQWMTAPANMPLWFLRDLMVVSLFTPVIYILIRKLGYWLMGLLTILYLSGVYAFIPGLSAYAIYFFTFGAFLSIRKKDLIVSLKRVEIPAYVLSIILAITMLLTYNTPVFSSLMLCFRLTGAIAVFCLASKILSTTTKRLPSVVSDSSYFIYLSHYVFFFSFIDIAFFAIFGTSIPALSLHYLLAPFLKITILTTIYIFYNRLKRTLV